MPHCSIKLIRVCNIIRGIPTIRHGSINWCDGNVNPKLIASATISYNPHFRLKRRDRSGTEHTKEIAALQTPGHRSQGSDGACDAVDISLETSWEIQGSPWSLWHVINHRLQSLKVGRTSDWSSELFSFVGQINMICSRRVFWGHCSQVALLSATLNSETWLFPASPCTSTVATKRQKCAHWLCTHSKSFCGHSARPFLCNFRVWHLLTHWIL
jgi:hypothetical protein